MKHIEFRNSQKKIATLSLLSLAALSQFGITAQVARADDDDDRDDNYIQVQNRERQRITVQGVVTDDRRGSEAFAIRASNGRTYLVDTRNTSQPNIDRGDRVEVRGRLSGGTIIANSVRITDNNSDNNSDDFNATLRGRVEDEQRGPNAFVLRADNGRTYLVNTRNVNEPNLSRGDIVEVRGRVTGGAIFANSVRVTDNNGGNGNNFGNFNAMVRGRVEDEQRGPDAFVLRASNGRTYVVDTRNVSEPNLDRGDIVEVRGRVSGSTIIASSVRVSNGNGRDGNNSNNGFGNDFGNRVNFTGTVQREGNGQFSVRADNGRDYLVQNSNVSVDYGDRVRVAGSLSRGVVRASNVVVIDRFGGNNDRDRRMVRLEGRILRVGNGFLIVRDSDDDQDRTVRVANADDFERGEVVVVTGRMRGDEIIATSINRR